MSFPFTRTEFFDVFEQYNQAVWPAQIGLNLVALSCIFLLFYKRPIKNSAISTGLVLLWLWMGVIYHFVFFSGINRAAILFGALFVLQSFLFFWFGVLKGQLEFRLNGRWSIASGSVLLLYALIFYPLTAYLVGHRYPAVPTFGLPCPTTIFTLGMLVFAKSPIPRTVWIIPIIWTLIGSMAAFQLGVYEDFGLLLAGIIGVFVVLNTLLIRKPQTSNF